MSIPKLISVDDHIIEPKTLWVDRVPAKLRERVPRVERTKAYVKDPSRLQLEFVVGENDPAARWADMWIYEDSQNFVMSQVTAAGHGRPDLDGQPVTYEPEDMRPGCYDQAARLADMDTNHTEVSMCFPQMSRFCGQYFMNRKDPELAQECIKVYNDWMIDEWCGGEASGRLVPITMVPMWDAELAAIEIRRCADKGSHAVTFCENPPSLGLPSLYTTYWDPFIAACEETDTVVNMHIGSSSTQVRTSADSPHLVQTTLFFQTGCHALIDWIFSGTLARFPNQRIALSEAQLGWMPFVLERMDKTWKRHDPIDELPNVPDLPSSYARGRVFACVFDDLHGLVSRDSSIGSDQIMFESDYPHADSTWPHTVETAETLMGEAKLSDVEVWKVIRGNAIECYRMDKYFGVTP
jgi:predicted TIM-barrel fold metal-dependent hydrolase